MSLQFNNKPLDSLTMEETIEFEKSVLKRILAAHSAGMSQEIIDQIDGFLVKIRAHKQIRIQEFISSSVKKNDKDEKPSGSLLIGEDEPQPSDDFE
jgi:hypothetical protein